VDEPTIYVSINGIVYDVTSGADFYGKGGGYNMLAGHDATRVLATSSLQASDVDGDIVGITKDQQKTLDEWVQRFNLKYPKVGTLAGKSKL
jgi:predicted heme/steroid binding protein